MKKYYTGVGSRETPQNILSFMKDTAYVLAKNGFILRSGGADGADMAFESGCNRANGIKNIFIPWNGFNNLNADNIDYFLCTNRDKYIRARNLAKTIHPRFNSLTEGGKKLHTRNIFQVLGFNLNRKSKFLICWTPNARIVGGTATAIKLAIQNNITVYNLANEKDKADLILMLSNLKKKG